uniref:Centrosomal protein 120 n=1 Tax=Neogobius melanostomus TaxID=47308 RepID=A0A8C6SJJ0_9GOBI
SSSRLSLIVQASFDGETLCADPVDHREQPLFSTELAWELNRRTLHQHRLQRTPIKLQCFAVDSLSNKRENVGYIVLDLRSVQEVKQEPRWYPLLSSKYTKQKPALLLALQLETDSKPSESRATEPDAFRAKKAPPRTAPPALELLPDRLQPTLVPDKGFHQLGPEDLCSEMFVLSVTVAFATKLQQLIPCDQRLAEEGSDFFFYYSLLGNDITSEPFHSLLTPVFEPERASVRIRSNKQVLQRYLSHENSLQIYLCCGSLSLGSADVSLSPLCAPSVDLDSKAATVEGAFVLKPPKKAASSVPEAPVVPLVPAAVELPSGADHGPSSPLLSPIPRAHPGPIVHTESEADSLMEELQHKGTSPHKRGEPAPQPGPRCYTQVTLNYHSVHSHRSVMYLWFVFVRYQYVFFGSAAPVMTNPAVELHRHSEIKLPQSYCAFDFAALPQQLHHTFHRVPLLVELWHRPLSSRDELIGRASLQLSHLLRSPRVKVQRSSGEQSWRQTLQERVPFVRVDRPSETVAELSFTAALDDLGLVKATEVVVSVSTLVRLDVQWSLFPPLLLPCPSPGAPRDTAEYRAALELELWKEEQEDLFDHQLRQKEQSHMQALAEEWRRRDQEREALLRKKELEYSALEEQLQKTLSDLEKREKRLAEAELQVCDGDARYKALEKEFMIYREQQNLRPEFRLQSDINLLTLEKVELERKLESTTKSKLHYKQQWGRALKELARFKQKEQENAMVRLKKQQQELEALRLKYLSSEERQELQEIRNQLNRLKDDRLGPSPSAPDPAPPADDADHLTDHMTDHLTRLLEERDTLLRTGVYTHDDRIISELNRQIQGAMATAR